MSDIRVDLDSVAVTEGQGIGEGDLELRIQVREGDHNLVFPSLNSFIRVDNKGVPQSIGAQVATYGLASGSLTKRFSIAVTEVDKGTLGQDDQGQGEITFDLTASMPPTSRSVIIPLKRPNMSFLGKVKVTLSAQQAA